MASEWTKSSNCSQSSCVEVRVDEDIVMVRSSRRPDLIAMFDEDEWAAFLTGVKAGKFDTR